MALNPGPQCCCSPPPPPPPPPTCGGISSAWFDICNTIQQVVWQITYTSCELQPGGGCISTETCADSAAEVVLVYDSAGTLKAPKNPAWSGTYEVDTVSTPNRVRLTGLTYGSIVYDIDSGVLQHVAGDCCLSLYIDAVTTRRIWDEDTVADTTFDVTFDGIESYGDCTDCDCANGQTAVAEFWTASGLFGGYYFTAYFRLTGVDSGCTHCAPECGATLPRTYDVDVVVGTGSGVSCWDCGGTPPCGAASGSVSWTDSNDGGWGTQICIDEITVGCCSGDTNVIMSSTIECSSLHPTDDPITADEWCFVLCSDTGGSELGGCDCSGGTVTAVENVPA